MVAEHAGPARIELIRRATLYLNALVRQRAAASRRDARAARRTRPD
jgi:hypothetical protein